MSGVDLDCTAGRPVEVKTVAVSKDELRKRDRDGGLAIQGEFLGVNISTAAALFSGGILVSTSYVHLRIGLG